MLTVRNIEVSYGGVTALRRVSIDIGRGETVLLVGANGAGKSSLIKAIIGAVAPFAGSIELEGRDLRRLRADQRARLGIGYSPEGRRVFATMSVRDNVLSGACGKPAREQRDAYGWLCEIFPLLREREAQPAGQLSGGQQQIVAFARAMCAAPQILLLDEPFFGLAPIWIARISDAIREIQRRGTTILMSEQMARPALKLATRGYVMRGGEVRHEGDVQTISALALSDEYL
ncbi:Branched-chain amino acid transport ATP-binding protein LivF [Candidatus Burkholderia verschuerenii]|uniref:Branched-chain amino acid transport ATP-binding protein LivF n=1 Tax=Candidatus Burkholderia verschuerenii TaxID=242163 RepID=A0A0L0MIH9_9BURK|nr:ABC transporter ATP-binding protein [Candidatus Burkholderia verschuerenii]KND62103.1 Branched-chain amino acid transport ATP-binding protein LivF [Candidatus Burkholderia verschuerenii]